MKRGLPGELLISEFCNHQNLVYIYNINFGL